MPSLLVSVRNLEEAEVARLAGVDLVDLKEPASGALGAIPPLERERIAEHWSQLPGNDPRPPLSLALGELLELSADEPLLGGLDSSLPGHGFRFVKVGLAGAVRDQAWPNHWRQFALQLPRPTALVAAAYADATPALAPEPEAVLDLALASGAEVFLLDTHAKQAGSIFEVLPPSRLASLRKRARGQLQFALAGSIREFHVDRLRELEPEIIAVRGAVCQADRSSPLCPLRLRRWRDLTKGW